MALGKHAMETTARDYGWITVPRFITAQELWSNVMGSGFETWHWWLAVSYCDDGDWNIPCHVTLSIADPEKERGGLIKTITITDIEVALDQLAMDGTPVNVDDLDAHTGDVVLQQAVLGKLVYG